MRRFFTERTGNSLVEPFESAAARRRWRASQADHHAFRRSLQKLVPADSVDPSEYDQLMDRRRGVAEMLEQHVFDDDYDPPRVAHPTDGDVLPAVDLARARKSKLRKLIERHDYGVNDAHLHIDIEFGMDHEDWAPADGYVDLIDDDEDDDDPDVVTSVELPARIDLLPEIVRPRFRPRFKGVPGERDPWERRVAILRAWLRATGGFDLPVTMPDRSYRVQFPLIDWKSIVHVGIWLQQIRARYICGQLNPVRCEQLEELEVLWKQQRRQTAEILTKLLLWHLECKDEPEKMSAVLNHPQIVRFLSFCRAMHRRGLLHESDREVLVGLGIDLDAPHVVDMTPVLLDLVSWKDTYGEWPQAHESRSLFLMMEQLRVLRDKGLLNDQIIGMLNRREFFWQGDPADALMLRLIHYVEEHGDSNVPPDYEDEKLVAFVGQLAADHARGVLSEDVKMQLEEIGFDFHRV